MRQKDHAEAIHWGLEFEHNEPACGEGGGQVSLPDDDFRRHLKDSTVCECCATAYKTVSKFRDRLRAGDD